MAKKLLLFVISFSLISTLSAQSNLSWKKLAKLADQQYQQGDFANAASNYEQAWQKKNKKKELIYKAGESYYTIKDYRKAAESYQYVKDDNATFPLVGLKYARSLKQDGQYDRAMEEFRTFGDNYTGQSKAILEDIIQTEIEGCTLGKELPLQADRDIQLSLLSNSINSDENEFAPFAVAPGEIYFSSSRGGKARIYGSRQSGNSWGPASIPNNFPVIQNGHFANGSLSPDGTRFYFTICNDDQGWDDLKSRCELFVTKKSAGGWGPPERLPDYVNLSGVTTTHPSSIHINGQEVLYFASNRDGGRGGMDLYYISRDLGIDNNDFTFPVNLGPSINTLGDEITPYYDVEEGLLYFASNGHVSVGGFDIFRSQGDEETWSIPDNIGLPFNSSADDYFFVKNADKTGGYLVSNRVYGGEKNTTRHSDIFSFSTGGQRIMLRANVYDKDSGNPLTNYTVNLYQIFDDGSENLLVNNTFDSGQYSFELLPNRRFRVEITSYGYAKRTYEFVTNNPASTTYGQPVFLGRASSTQPPTTGNPSPSRPTTRPPSQPNTNVGGNTRLPLLAGTQPGVTYTSRGTSRNDSYEYISKAPRYRGTYFKVQLAAVSTFKENSFSDAKTYGRIDTEEIISRRLIRVLVGDYFSEQEVISTVKKLKRMGYEKAYAVKYEDGVRYGRFNF